MLRRLCGATLRNALHHSSYASVPTFCTSKSQQQQAYFKSRQAMYDAHQYPHFVPTKTVHQFLQAYAKLKQSQQQQQVGNESAEHQQAVEKIVGRVSAIRKHGKTTFVDLREQHLRLQVAVRTDKELEIKRGDVVGVQGEAFITKKGELSIHCHDVQDIQLLAPCMWMLPEYECLKDHEARYRNKPLDLISNSHSVQQIIKRAKAISTLRKQLQSQGYVEVQTPVLSSSCGGAIAKPFVTYHNDHKANLFLRIAPELYLKKLLVGGLLRVFEIGKNFRNESIDQTHNPEFTTCQLYSAYEDYQGMMKFTHRLVNKIAMEVNGTTIVKGTDSQGNTVDIDLSKEWEVKDFMPDLEKALKIKLPIDFDNPETFKFYEQLCQKQHINLDQPRTIERMLDKLGEKYLETTHEPFFIVNHPKVMSPLAKPIPEHPHLTQRFELFVNGFELVNSYTELNDPRIQRQNTPGDVDFVEALEYGLMPCAGWGIGVDRLVMLLTHSQRIQEVIAFPLLREALQREQPAGTS